MKLSPSLPFLFFSGIRYLLTFRRFSSKEIVFYIGTTNFRNSIRKNAVLTTFRDGLREEISSELEQSSLEQNAEMSKVSTMFVFEVTVFL